MHEPWNVHEHRALLFTLGFAEKEGFFFIETSALDSTNVDDAFCQILTEIYWLMNRKALSAEEDGYPGAPGRGQTIDVNAPPPEDNKGQSNLPYCCTA